jgi:hypothetical protein
MKEVINDGFRSCSMQKSRIQELFPKPRFKSRLGDVEDALNVTSIYVLCLAGTGFSPSWCPMCSTCRLKQRQLSICYLLLWRKACAFCLELGSIKFISLRCNTFNFLSKVIQVTFIETANRDIWKDCIFVSASSFLSRHCYLLCSHKQKKVKYKCYFHVHSLVAFKDMLSSFHHCYSM